MLLATYELLSKISNALIEIVTQVRLTNFGILRAAKHANEISSEG